MTKKKLSRMAKALLEMAADQHRIGLMNDVMYRRILVRHLGEEAAALQTAANPTAPRTRPRIRKD